MFRFESAQEVPRKRQVLAAVFHWQFQRIIWRCLVGSTFNFLGNVHVCVCGFSHSPTPQPLVAQELPPNSEFRERIISTFGCPLSKRRPLPSYLGGKISPNKVVSFKPLNRGPVKNSSHSLSFRSDFSHVLGRQFSGRKKVWTFWPNPLGRKSRASNSQPRQRLRQKLLVAQITQAEGLFASNANQVTRQGIVQKCIYGYMYHDQKTT